MPKLINNGSHFIISVWKIPWKINFKLPGLSNCIVYFSVAVIKNDDQDQDKDFVWTHGFRGISVYNDNKLWQKKAGTVARGES